MIRSWDARTPTYASLRQQFVQCMKRSKETMINATSAAISLCFPSTRLQNLGARATELEREEEEQEQEEEDICPPLLATSKWQGWYRWQGLPPGLLFFVVVARLLIRRCHE